MDVDNNDGGGPVPSSAASDPAGEEKAAEVDESDRVLRFGDLVRIVGK